MAERSRSTEATTPSIDLLVGTKMIFAGWRTVLVGVALGLVVSVATLHLATPEYTISYKITSISSGGNNLPGGANGLGGVAASFGVVLGQANSSATPFELYCDLLTSQAMADHLARNQAIMRIAFEGDWKAGAGEWREPTSVNYRLVQGVKTILGYPQRRWRPPNAADLRRYLEKNIVVRRPGARDPPITVVSIEHRDTAFGKLLLADLDRTADGLVRREALDRATKYSTYLVKRLPLATIAEVRTFLAKELADQEKAIMIAGSGPAFAAFVVEPGTASLQPTNPDYPLVVGFCLLVGLFAGAVVAMYREMSPT